MFDLQNVFKAKADGNVSEHLRDIWTRCNVNTGGRIGVCILSVCVCKKEKEQEVDVDKMITW